MTATPDAKGARRVGPEESAVWYQAILSSINGIALSDLDGNLTFVNRSFLRLWGYDDSGDVIGRHASEFWETGAQAHQVIAALHEEGGWVGEMTARRRSGETFPVQLCATTVRDRLGRPVGMMGSFLDLTERRRAEGKVRHATRLYRLLSEVNEAIVRTRDCDGLFRAVCRVAVEHGGFRMAWVGLLDESSGALRPAAHAGHEEGYLERIEIRPGDAVTGRGPSGIALREGRIAKCEDIASDPLMLPWRDAALARGYRSSAAIPFGCRGRVVGTLNLYAAEPGFFTEDERRLLEEIGLNVGFALDTLETARESARAEADLAAAKARLDFMMANSPAVIYTCRPSGDYGATFVSSNIEGQLGYRPEEMVSDSGFWASRIHPEDAPRVFAGVAELFEKGAHSHEYRFRHKDGSWRWMHDELKVIRDGSGAPLELLGSWLDITERKRADEERLQLERRLLHAQKLESLGVLAGGIAHDFNNLLMAILGNLDLALLKLPELSPARVHVEQSAQAAWRATDLTRQLLAYSGRGSFVVKAMDLNELVEENARLFRAAIARTATLSLQLTRPLPPIEADAGQVQQVVMNLITNASDAIGERPGVIALATGVEECDERRLAASRLEEVPPPGTFVFLEVSDTGAGMGAEALQRLFDPFFTTKKTGRGLGMSAILGIVRGHRGAVFVESAEGKGTRIRILLPAASTPAEARGGGVGEASTAAAPPHGGTVLIVDDEEEVLGVCRGMMEHLGFAVLTAPDGRDAVALFRELAAEISLVILDLSMPVMDGATALAEILRIRPDANVILSSGYDRSETARGLPGARAASFVQKPYTLDRLREAVQAALGNPGGANG